jgi:ribosome-associated protein
MDLHAVSSVTDFFVICTADTGRQLDALKEHIEATLAKHGGRVGHVEGAAASGGSARAFEREPQWVLLDCGDVVVHLLDQHARSFYRLEELWADAPRVELPQDPARLGPA